MLIAEVHHPQLFRDRKVYVRAKLLMSTTACDSERRSDKSSPITEALLTRAASGSGTDQRTEKRARSSVTTQRIGECDKYFISTDVPSSC